jgi:predicted nucleic acid-binding Zn ribbon protein
LAVTDERLDERLARLARQTERLGTKAGFADRVMLAIQTEATTDWRASVLAASRWVLVAAGVVVVGTGLVAFESRRSTDAAAAVAFGTVELSSW